MNPVNFESWGCGQAHTQPMSYVIHDGDKILAHVPAQACELETLKAARIMAAAPEMYQLLRKAAMYTMHEALRMAIDDLFAFGSLNAIERDIENKSAEVQS